MERTKQQIDSKLLMVSIICFMQASTPLLGFLTGVAKQNTWIVIILGYIISLPILLIYTTLATKFPGKNLIEINEVVLGKFIGKIFSTLYIFFFFSLAFLNSTITEGFVSKSMLEETPKAVITIMFIFICVWAIRKGMENIMRCSTLFVIVEVIVILLNTILSSKNMKLSNLNPSFTLTLGDYLQGVHNTVAIPVCNIVVLFMLFPNVKGSDGIKKSVFVGSSVGIFSLLWVVVRDTAVLGPVIGMVANPTFETTRLIDIGNILTRMEVVYGASLIMLLFFKIAILLYATVKGIAQIFELRSYKFLIPTVGALVASFSLMVFNSEVETAYWGQHLVAFYSTFFEVILPVITITVASIRFRKKNRAKA